MEGQKYEKIVKLYYQNKIKEITFKDNWIEQPLFYNNPNKSIRFLLESKLEQRKYDLIKNVFFDIFYEYGNMITLVYADKGINHRKIKEYFKYNSLKKMLKEYYNSKLDPTWLVINKPYYVAYLS